MRVAALIVKCCFFTQLGATGADAIGEVLSSKREAEKRDEQADTEEQLIGAAKIRAVATPPSDLPGIPVKPARVRHDCVPRPDLHVPARVKAWLCSLSWFTCTSQGKGMIVFLVLIYMYQPG